MARIYAGKAQKKTEYQVLVSSTPSELSTVIGNWLAAGWELQGGVACIVPPENPAGAIWWAQAITRVTYEP